MTTRVNREADWLRASKGSGLSGNPENHASRPGENEYRFAALIVQMAGSAAKSNLFGHPALTEL